MNIRGLVKEIGATQNVSDTFSKRDLIIEYAENPTYPEYIKFDTLQDKTALLDELRVGDEVEVHFNLRGRPWTNKEGVTSYFNGLVVWKIDISRPVAGDTPKSVEPVYDDLPF